MNPVVDAEGFALALRNLRAEVDAQLGPADYRHLRRLAFWSRACTLLGYATAWLFPNPLSALLLSLGNVSRWTILAHHISHRALDRVPGVPARYTSHRFAHGLRRFLDWPDWILPAAWHEEHNILHHYHTGELADPDLVEDNTRVVRELRAPLFVKYAIVAYYACTWKLTYYAPNTFQHLAAARRRRAGLGRGEPPAHYAAAFNPLTVEGRTFWLRCIAPYSLFRFALIPALFLLIGKFAALSVLLNTLLGELFANLHSFLIIAPNHAGDDVYRFDGRCRDRADFCVRQVMGSVNFRSRGPLSDFLMGYLNYQIEHHLFPDLPPARYRELSPRIRDLCAAHGVPYVEESLPKRIAKLISIMVGTTSMKRLPAPTTPP